MMGEGRGTEGKEDREKRPGQHGLQTMRSRKSEKIKEQTKNRLNTSRSSRAKLIQGACTLFLPLLLAHPHVVLVGDLKKIVLVRAEVK